ncbi:MAG TPA: hypothetical protein VNQ77_05265 [Frankiaceae bacterium]|nr:hypothetical protein [Frankiaceae bacterium]
MSGVRRSRALAASVVVAVLVAFVAVLYQRPVAQWGSTGAERHGPVAGDVLVADPDTRWTRAITIDAPPERVWPWLVQLGVDKGGFYTYDWGEQLAGDPVHNATAIKPAWQRLSVGDPVKPFPTGEPWVVRELVAPSRLVLGGDGGAWSFAFELRPRGDGTRLVTRMNARKTSPVSYALDVADLVVLPRMLVGVKQRAEGTLPGMPDTPRGEPFPMARLPVQPATAMAWVGVLSVAAALGGVLGFGAWGRRRRHTGATVALAFALGAAYALTTDTPPVTFFSHTWGVAVPLGVALGVVLRAYVLPDRAWTPGRWVPRGAAAVAETGAFVVLPATVLWQAATAGGLVTSWRAHVLVGAAAALGAAGVARIAWRTPRGTLAALLLAGGYAATGSAVVPLLAAALAETARRRTVHVTEVHVEERLRDVHLVAP